MRRVTFGPTSQLPSLPVDPRFGPFRILAPIGRGGMSDTFLAERDGPAGVVHRICLKRMRRTEADDPKWIAMFQREARIAAQLHHQNIVPLHDFGQENGTWWMSYHLVEGTDLRAIAFDLRQRGEALAIDAIVFIALEIAKALDYAHGRTDARGEPLGLVHRDVSPGNILVSEDGAVLLTDFGIAKVTQSERTRTGEMKGKAPYMSPEHAHARPLDGRSDLFSLGVVLFELVTKTRPFDGKTWLATQQNAVLGRRCEIRDLAPDTPPWLVAVIDRLLRPDPDLRYGSARALFDELCAQPLRPSAVQQLGVHARAARARMSEGDHPTRADRP
jgi:serine/threonine protein kinase